MFQYSGLYMNNSAVEQYDENSKKNFKLDRSLEVKLVENGYILPSKEDAQYEKRKLWALGGVADKHGEFVPDSEFGMIWGGEYKEGYDSENIEEIDEEVLFMGPFVEHWGHFMCDEISRLWYLCKKDFSNIKVAYCSWCWGGDAANYNIFGNFLELMHLIGIKDSQLINITKPTRFKKIIIPERSFIAGEYYSEEYRLLIRTIINNANFEGIKSYDKIYFTRQNFLPAQGKEYGEKELQNFFCKNGYEILSPESLTVQEQIYYFQNCKKIAMLSGTIAHNILFASPGLEVTILNKLSLINDYQKLIDHISDASITYIDVFYEIFPVLHGAGPFWIGLNKHFKHWAKSQGIRHIRTKRMLGGWLWYLKKWKEQYVDNQQLKGLLKEQQAALKGNRK